MPGNTKQRKRKHRGTKTGKVDTRGRTGRPRSRKEAMDRARKQRSGKGSGKQQTDRRLIAPTWRSAINRGLFFALLLFPISLLFGQPVPGALILTLIAAVFYVPLGYYTDRFFYRRRMAKLQAEKQAKKQGGGG